MNECPKSRRIVVFGGFTLLEVLVSIAILSLILWVLASVTTETDSIWKTTNSEIEQFQSARIGFDTMTHRLAEATLNTYMGYSDGTPGDTFYSKVGFAPSEYVRQTELRFLSGASSSTAATFPGTMNGVTLNNVANSPIIHPTHSVFFEVPTGYNSTPSYRPLSQTLNLCGYYVEFGSDTSTLPSFLATNTPRYRFRLMELLEPSENNSIYGYTTGSNAQQSLNPISSLWNQWIRDPLNITPTASAPVHILAENIIALILLPQLGQDQISLTTNKPFLPSDLAPYYDYDTTQNGAAASPTLSNPTGRGTSASGTADAGALNSIAQLPPLIQVTMVSIDEPSAVRLQKLSNNPSTPPDFGINSGNLFQNAADYQSDLAALKANLQKMNVAYRVFTTTVSIKAAQWSTIQTGS